MIYSEADRSLQGQRDSPQQQQELQEEKLCLYASHRWDAMSSPRASARLKEKGTASYNRGAPEAARLAARDSARGGGASAPVLRPEHVAGQQANDGELLSPPPAAPSPLHPPQQRLLRAAPAS